MARFRLAKDARKEQTEIGKKVAQAGGGIAAQKSASMWGSIGGGLAGAALVGIAGVSTFLTGGALAPLWLTMAGTGVGAAVGSKLGEEVIEGGGLGRGGLYKATIGNLTGGLASGGKTTYGEADYEKGGFIDPNKSKFYKAETQQAQQEIQSMSDQVSNSHITTGLKAAALAGAGDIVKGTKLFGKGTGTLGEVLKAPKGTFTSAKAMAVKEAVDEKNLAWSTLVEGKDMSALELKSARLKELGLDAETIATGANEATQKANTALAETYQKTQDEVKQRFWEQGNTGTKDFTKFVAGEEKALKEAGTEGGEWLTQQYQQDLKSYNQMGVQGNHPIRDYQKGGKAGTGFSFSNAQSTGTVDKVGFQTSVTPQINKAVKKLYKTGMSVKDAEAQVMEQYGISKPSMMEAVFSKKKMGEYAWNN